MWHVPFGGWRRPYQSTKQSRDPPSSLSSIHQAVRSSIGLARILQIGIIPVLNTHPRRCYPLKHTYFYSWFFDSWLSIEHNFWGIPQDLSGNSSGDWRKNLRYTCIIWADFRRACCPCMLNQAEVCVCRDCFTLQSTTCSHITFWLAFKRSHELVAGSTKRQDKPVFKFSSLVRSSVLEVDLDASEWRKPWNCTALQWRLLSYTSH